MGSNGVAGAGAAGRQAGRGVAGAGRSPRRVLVRGVGLQRRAVHLLPHRLHALLGLAPHGGGPGLRLGGPARRARRVVLGAASQHLSCSATRFAALSPLAACAFTAAGRARFAAWRGSPAAQSLRVCD